MTRLALIGFSSVCGVADNTQDLPARYFSWCHDTLMRSNRVPKSGNIHTASLVTYHNNTSNENPG